MGLLAQIAGALDVMRLLVNLRFQVFLVCQDVPVPFGDGLLFTYPDLLSHLGKKKKKNWCRNEQTSIENMFPFSPILSILYLGNPSARLGSGGRFMRKVTGEVSI